MTLACGEGEGWPKAAVRVPRSLTGQGTLRPKAAVQAFWPKMGLHPHGSQVTPASGEGRPSRRFPKAGPYAVSLSRRAFLALAGSAALSALAGCASASERPLTVPATEPVTELAHDATSTEATTPAATTDTAETSDPVAQAQARVEALRAQLPLTEDFRPSFVHGEKPVSYQRYLVLHDTEGAGTAESVIDYWDSNGKLVAAHFVINKDGSVVQCVPLDKICHHAGYGDTGHNALFGVEDESRDDKAGTTPIGSWAADYGMNSYSIGIELVHVGGEGDYPAAQLATLDALVAYLDAWCEAGGVAPSRIIDHKAWRSGNSDTSPEFAGYLASYQERRTHA